MRTEPIPLARFGSPSAVLGALLQQARIAAKRATPAGGGSASVLSISELDDLMLRDMGMAQVAARGGGNPPMGWAVGGRRRGGAPVFLGR